MMQSTMKQIATLNGRARLFLRLPWNLKFSIIGLGQEDEIEENTLRPEIWWHGKIYHETDHSNN